MENLKTKQILKSMNFKKNENLNYFYRQCFKPFHLKIWIICSTLTLLEALTVFNQL